MEHFDSYIFSKIESSYSVNSNAEWQPKAQSFFFSKEYFFQDYYCILLNLVVRRLFTPNVLIMLVNRLQFFFRLLIVYQSDNAS